MVRMNAVAMGVDVVHAAVTGHSTFLYADGTRSGTESGLFTGEVIYADNGYSTVAVSAAED